MTVVKKQTHIQPGHLRHNLLGGQSSQYAPAPVSVSPFFLLTGLSVHTSRHTISDCTRPSLTISHHEHHEYRQHPSSNFNNTSIRAISNQQRVNTETRIVWALLSESLAYRDQGRAAVEPYQPACVAISVWGIGWEWEPEVRVIRPGPRGRGIGVNESSTLGWDGIGMVMY
jgi:hypothetical protein